MRVAGKLLRVRVLALLFELDSLVGRQSDPSVVLAGRSLLVLVAAALLDFWIGDPWGWLHPVQVMGGVIERYRQWAIAWSPAAWLMRLVGVGLTVLLVLGTGLLSTALLGALNLLSPVLSAGVEVILLASCFAGRSLRRAADDVLTALPKVSKADNYDDAGDAGDFEPGSLDQARDRLALYVGRDTAQLSAREIRRAVMETVSENAIDGVLAPLFYALVGSAFSSLLIWRGWTGTAWAGAGLSLAVPTALAYKAASTLDSMVGYRDMPYTDLGWCSARFEDVITWLPCRLSVLTIAVLSGRPWRVWAICWRDARADPSPNAGWSECAYAAALGVQLGGANIYQGKLTVKPALGDATRPITDAVIAEALSITRCCFLIGLSLGCALLLAVFFITPL
ncbi:MAG: adenosylcobinamide-phosphate synthase CbiB [Cyanobacteria bacterium J06623_4]